MDQTRLSPYELLGLSVRATIPEIMKAYQSALKARKYTPSLLAWALGALRDPRTRLLHDLAVPDHDALCGELARELNVATGGSVFSTLDVTLIPIEPLAMADRAAFPTDQRAIAKMAVAFERPVLLDATDEFVPLLEFPS